MLPAIIRRASGLHVHAARNGEKIVPGRVYVAVPDHHLVVTDGEIRVARGPHENRHRPAIDPLFRTAARWYGPRVVAVLLSGALDDGVAGLSVVKAHGGIVLVQDPKEAAFPQMPLNAINFDEPDHSLGVVGIAKKIVELVNQPVRTVDKASGELVRMDEAEGIGPGISETPSGHPSPFACPACNGVLWEDRIGDFEHFTCRIGHSYSPENLLEAEREALESALWQALRALEEATHMSRRMAKRANDHYQKFIAARYEEEAASKEQQARLIRRMLLHEKTRVGVEDENHERVSETAS